jgi:hypothetical protein
VSAITVVHIVTTLTQSCSLGKKPTMLAVTASSFIPSGINKMIRKHITKDSGG